MSVRAGHLVLTIANREATGRHAKARMESRRSLLSLYLCDDDGNFVVIANET